MFLADCILKLKNGNAKMPSSKNFGRVFDMIRGIAIDKRKCIHCGKCIRDCIVSCISFDGDKIPAYIEGGEKLCVGCQHCMAICPVGALSFGGKNPADSEPTGNWDGKELLRLIKSRRSFRFYKNQDIPPDTLKKLADMLSYPPTGGNRENLHFSIVGTAQKMRELSRFTYEKLQAREKLSPIMEFALERYKKGADVVYRGAASLVAVSIDLSKTIPGCETADPIIPMAYLDLYAQSLGLGTLWTDITLTIAREMPEVRALLEIPDGYTLDYVMLLGIPAIKYQRTVQREPAHFKII